MLNHDDDSWMEIDDFNFNDHCLHYRNFSFINCQSSITLTETNTKFKIRN